MFIVSVTPVTALRHLFFQLKHLPKLHTFPNSSTAEQCNTHTHTRAHTNKGKSSQFRYDSLRFENSIITVFDTLLFITDPIYAATPPPYSSHTNVF